MVGLSETMSEEACVCMAVLGSMFGFVTSVTMFACYRNVILGTGAIVRFYMSDIFVVRFYMKSCANTVCYMDQFYISSCYRIEYHEAECCRQELSMIRIIWPTFFSYRNSSINKNVFDNGNKNSDKNLTKLFGVLYTCYFRCHTYDSRMRTILVVNHVYLIMHKNVDKNFNKNITKIFLKNFDKCFIRKFHKNLNKNSDIIKSFNKISKIFFDKSFNKISHPKFNRKIDTIFDKFNTLKNHPFIFYVAHFRSLCFKVNFQAHFLKHYKLFKSLFSSNKFIIYHGS